ncbi:hypothetical protein BB559_006057 [Furculomyces boomerangus]|uniref:Aminoglycoside phosphotransferase domain-containing protein n=2 Tax=Harpellales TaxID=61421 RepID=A0A2T9Y531_9FUNG|nr:hypothetical protein BB559_006057 [Furculomyces boomerangus]PWA00817.1 hypothetical protein BB558_003124 [Smittium angustum]
MIILDENWKSSIHLDNNKIMKIYHDIDEKTLVGHYNLLKYLSTLIKIPQIYGYEYKDREGTITMEFIDGKNADISDSDTIKHDLLLLKKNINPAIGNHLTGEITDSLFMDPNLPKIYSMRQLISEKLKCDIQRVKNIDTEIYELLLKHQKWIISIDFKDEPNELVHNDVNFRNIIKRDNELYYIDWDLSGFYPDTYVQMKHYACKQDIYKAELNEDYGILVKLFKQLQRYQAKCLSELSIIHINKKLKEMLSNICPVCGKEMTVSEGACSCE